MADLEGLIEDARALQLSLETNSGFRLRLRLGWLIALAFPLGR